MASQKRKRRRIGRSESGQGRAGPAWRAFTGEALRTLAFPLGGIGTGTVSLDGYGQLRDWEIFNRPGKGEAVPYSFFAIWMRPAGGRPIARVLEGRRPGPYNSGWGGLSPDQVPGLPRFARSRATCLYPFMRVELSDPALPVRVALEAFTPFIPLDEHDSSLPVAVLRYRITNRTDRRVAVSVAGSLLNVVGYEGRQPVQGRHHPSLGLNRNRFVREKGLAGLAMTSRKPAVDAPGFGSLALATTHAGALSCLSHWGRGAHWDDAQRFWEDFAHDGRVRGDDRGESCHGEGEHGSLVASTALAPHGQAEVTYLIAWHFPNRAYDRNPVGTRQHFRLRNWHTSHFADAWAVARYTAERLEALEGMSRCYSDTLAASTLPPPVIDAAGSQACIIRTNTCFRTADGNLLAYEGCRDQSGSCPMNCTHVFNYEQTLAFLFPSLEQTMRDIDFGINTAPDGNMAFRTLLPLSNRRWDHPPAADGQMGTILKLYREWQFSGDPALLERHWPAARRALDFAWARESWDADGDGVMEGTQHNTYDIEFEGPNTMTGTLYLGALKAGAVMARAAGEDESADRYDALRRRGERKLDRMLFNGRWYVQKGVDVRTTRYQFGRGCLSDQLLGQWFCHVVGLGYILPADHVRRALRAIYEHNFKTDLSEHQSVQRVYAVNDEAGLLLCTWPAGGRPPLPFIYADEVWTGVEYQVAAHLIYEGFVEEGLTIVRAVRNRYDGERRNPFDEIECGHQYARAMASWSLILALSGYRYAAPQQAIGFSPRVQPQRFACFFSTGTGWGLFEQKAGGCTQSAALSLRYGTLDLRTIHLAWAGDGSPPTAAACTVHLDRRRLPAQLVVTREGLSVQLAESVTFEKGQKLSLRIGPPASRGR